MGYKRVKLNAADHALEKICEKCTCHNSCKEKCTEYITLHVTIARIESVLQEAVCLQTSTNRIVFQLNKIDFGGETVLTEEGELPE